jgi:hypothetical protein
MGILVRHRKSTAPGKRLRREWRGLGACGERSTGHESEGKPEKMSAFHVPLLVFRPSIVKRDWRQSAECALNHAFRKRGLFG